MFDQFIIHSKKQDGKCEIEALLFIFHIANEVVKMLNCIHGVAQNIGDYITVVMIP